MNYHQLFDILKVLSKKEIKTRYKNSYFGYLWSLANPVAFAFVFYFAFEVVFKVKVDKYILFLMTGLFSWQWTSNYIGVSTKLFVMNTSLLKKVYFPRYIIPLAVIIQDAFHFIMTIPIILLLMFYYDVSFNANLIIGVPLIFIAQFLMLYGIGLFLSCINLFFRDIEHIVLIIMNMAFYMTPVLYPIDKLPETMRPYMYLNIFAPNVLAWRELILEGSISPLYVGLSYGYAILLIILGLITYRKTIWKVPEII